MKRLLCGPDRPDAAWELRLRRDAARGQWSATTRPTTGRQTEASDEALPLAGGGYADGYDVRIAKRVAEELGFDIEIVKDRVGRAGAPRCSPATSTFIIAGMSPTAEAHGHHRLHRPLL